MSHPLIDPGRGTSEHARAWRAEVAGLLLLAVGLVLLFLPGSIERTCAAVALSGLGAWVVVRTAETYCAARSGVKAAGVRRPQDQAPRAI